MRRICLIKKLLDSSWLVKHLKDTAIYISILVLNTLGIFFKMNNQTLYNLTKRALVGQQLST